MLRGNEVVSITILLAGASLTLAKQICGLKEIGSSIDTAKTYTYNDSASGRIKICIKCPPGSHRISDRHCSDSNSIDHCQCCQPGTFSYTFDQATSCADCNSYCPYHNAKLTKECSRFHDIVCDCEVGFFFHKEFEDCLEHGFCGLGEGVISEGTNGSDTACEKCEENINFSNRSSKTDRCQPCTKCMSNEEVHRNCIPTMDTFCRVPEEDSSWKIGVIIGLVGIFALLAVGFCIYRRFNRKHGDDTEPEKNLSVIGQNRNDESVSPEMTKQITDPTAEQFRKIFDMISKKCDPNWRSLIRELPWGIDSDPDAIIRELEQKYRDHLYEQQYHALSRFREATAGLTPELFVTYLPDRSQLHEDARCILNSYNNHHEDRLQEGKVKLDVEEDSK